MTFDEALAAFLQSRSAKGCATNTVEWYRQQIEEFHAWLLAQAWNGGRWLRPETIEGFLAAERARGMKPGTVQARYRALLAFFSWLSTRGYLGAEPSPLGLVERPRVPEDVRDYVRPEEMRALLSRLPDETWTDLRDRLILLILFWSGLRVKELCSLALPDVDPRTELVTVRRGKGGKSRIVPCAPEVPEVLLSYLYQRPAWRGPELLLSNDGAGGVRGALTPEGVRQMLRRRCALAGLRYLHPHAWRHGFAMAFLNAGAEMSSISAMMGHSSTNLTERIYARWLTDGLSAEYGRALARING